MQRGCFGVYLLVGCFFLTTSAATAQEVVHALCQRFDSFDQLDLGQNESRSVQAQAMALLTSSTRSRSRMLLSTLIRKIRAEATTADTFTKSGALAV